MGGGVSRFTVARSTSGSRSARAAEAHHLREGVDPGVGARGDLEPGREPEGARAPRGAPPRPWGARAGAGSPGRRLRRRRSASRTVASPRRATFARPRAAAPSRPDRERGGLSSVGTGAVSRLDARIGELPGGLAAPQGARERAPLQGLLGGPGTDARPGPARGGLARVGLLELRGLLHEGALPPAGHRREAGRSPTDSWSGTSRRWRGHGSCGRRRPSR